MECPIGDLNVDWGIMLNVVSSKLWEKNAFTISNQECLFFGTREKRKFSDPCEGEMGSREAS